MIKYIRCLYKSVFSAPFENSFTYKLARNHVLKENVRSLSKGEESLKSRRDDSRLLQDFFCDFLGTTGRTTAKRLQYYKDVTRKPLHTIKETATTLEELGFQRTDVVSNLQILALPKTVVQHRYRCLQELGFNDIEAPEIICYDFILSSSIDNLCGQSILPNTVDPFSNMIKLLQCPHELEYAIMGKCRNPKLIPLQQLREFILSQIIVYYLGFEEEVVRNILNSNHKLPKSCVVSVKTVLEIYQKQFSLSPEIFLHHPNMLSVFEDDLIEFLKLGELYEVDIKRIISRLPSVLKCRPENFDLICRILIDYGMSVKHIHVAPKLLLMSPEYVSGGLAALSSWPEFHILKVRPTFISVLMDYKRASLHMDYLKKAGFERCSVSLLLSSDEEFKQHLCHGEETKTCKEIVAYVAERLECSTLEAFNGLRHHPSLPKTSVITVKTTLAYLFKKGFSREQIRRGIALILYPRSKVARNWLLLPKLDIAQPFQQWKDSPNILQLLLYAIEKRECIFMKPVPIPTMIQTADLIS